MGLVREYKQCPDCAEEVLAAARKCRFCGYRFDTGRREVSPGGLLAGLIHKKPEVSLPELLAEWGVSLRESEEMVSFLLVDVDGEPRFMLVTSDRLVLASVTSPTEPEHVIVHRLADLSRVELGKRRLELLGPHFRYLVGGLRSAELQRLAGHLTGRSRP